MLAFLGVSFVRICKAFFGTSGHNFNHSFPQVLDTDPGGNLDSGFLRLSGPLCELEIHPRASPVLPRQKRSHSIFAVTP